MQHRAVFNLGLKTNSNKYVFNVFFSDEQSTFANIQLRVRKDSAVLEIRSRLTNKLFVG